MLLTIGQGLGLCYSKTSSDSGISSPAEIANLKLWIDAQSFSTITFLSGSGDGDPISSVSAPEEGYTGVYNEHGGYPMEYAASGLHGKPAFIKPNVRSLFRDENQGNPALYSAAVTLVYFFSGAFDGTADSGDLFSLYNTSALVNVSSATAAEYIKNEALANVTFGGTYDLTNVSMAAVSIADVHNAIIKLNDQDTVSFNPHNNYSNLGGAKLGTHSASRDGVHHEIYGAMIYDRALTDDELAQLYEYGVTRYGA